MLGAIIGDIDGHRYLENGCRLGFSRILGNGANRQTEHASAAYTELTAFLMEATDWVLKIRRGEPVEPWTVSGTKDLILGIVIGYAVRNEDDIQDYLRKVEGPARPPDVGKLARAVFRARRHDPKAVVRAVYDEAPIGVEAFVQTDNFQDALTTSFALGDDAALDGMVCGAVAGAYYGIDNGIRSSATAFLPPPMLNALQTLEDGR